MSCQWISGQPWSPLHSAVTSLRNRNTQCEGPKVTGDTQFLLICISQQHLRLFGGRLIFWWWLKFLHAVLLPHIWPYCSQQSTTGAKPEEVCWLLAAGELLTGEFLLLWEAAGLHGLSYCATENILKHPKKTLQERISVFPDCVIIPPFPYWWASEKADEFYLYHADAHSLPLPHYGTERGTRKRGKKNLMDKAKKSLVIETQTKLNTKNKIIIAKPIIVMRGETRKK